MCWLRRLSWLLALALSLEAVTGQACKQEMATLGMRNSGDCGSIIALSDCLAQLEVMTAPTCAYTLVPGIRMAVDGSFCQRNVGTGKRGVVSGEYQLGQKPFAFNMAASKGTIILSLAGTYMPPTGGREINIDCKMQFVVLAGSLLGVQGTIKTGLPGYSAQPASLAGPTLNPSASRASQASALQGSTSQAATLGTSGLMMPAVSSGAFSPSGSSGFATNPNNPGEFNALGAAPGFGPAVQRWGVSDGNRYSSRVVADSSTGLSASVRTALTLALMALGLILLL